MKIKWGALVVDGRGKLGGHVAAQNKAGSYLRTKVTPGNPQTTFQSVARAMFGAISAAWSGLGLPAVKAWNAAVESWAETNIFGDIKNPSGKSLFQRLNNQAQAAGYPAVLAVPAKLPMPTGVLTNVAAKVAGALITPTGLYSGVDARVMMFASPPVTIGTTFVKNQMRLVASSLASAVVPATLGTAYQSKYGTLVAGQKIFFGFKYVLPNGQASPLQILSTIVVA